jgi:hypothetical protein
LLVKRWPVSCSFWFIIQKAIQYFKPLPTQLQKNVAGRLR